MYNIKLTGILNTYEYEELAKVFLKPVEFIVSVEDGVALSKNETKRNLYQYLSELTGKKPEWGILTGVRPVKLTSELFEKYADKTNEELLKTKVKNVLLNEYLVSETKADLLISIYEYQKGVLEKTEEDKVGIYIGIPFCPTRCLYCSFTSNQASDSKITAYMGALYKEIEFVATEMKTAKLKLETIYIGGGTPTTLDADKLRELLAHIRNSFDFSELKEFTVEAGRPDTIDAEKIRVIKDAGVSRISINPQSMHDKTLKLIGRSHTADDIEDAFSTVRTCISEANTKSNTSNLDTNINSGFDIIINADVIAGLPCETVDDYIETLKKVIALEPENITIHTLAVKRASKLVDENRDYHYEHGEIVKDMMSQGNELLKKSGYVPYYLYRQKHMTGNLENVGWCKKGTAGIYNIRIMEENQTIIALGAGGITKVFYPDENRIERVPNVSNYEIYCLKIEDMINRKRENLFIGRKNDVN